MDVTSLSLPDESGTPSRPIRPAPDPAAGQVFADNVDETGEIERPDFVVYVEPKKGEIMVRVPPEKINPPR